METEGFLLCKMSAFLGGVGVGRASSSRACGEEWKGVSVWAGAVLKGESV